MNRPYLLLVACFLILSGCKRSAPTPPNIVVLFTDDQRFNTIHAWGNDAIHTPNIDRLARMGVSFTRTHVMGSFHGAVCAPSRAMLLSGIPYFNIPSSYIDRGLADYQRDFDFMTFPEYYRNKGYNNFFTGKWHNHTSKLRQGFEKGKNIFIGGMHFPKVGGHRHPELWNYDPTGAYPKEKKWQGSEFSSKMYSDAAIEFIQQQSEDHPFCLYVAYTSPHDPREAPEEYLALYDTVDIDLPPNYMPQHPFDNGHLGTRDENLAPFPRTPAIIKSEIAGYYAMISEVDAQVGRVIDALEQKKLLNQTIIVFAGDNGLAVGQHGLLGKQNLYDHSVRVPLIIAAPGVQGNRTSNTLCYLHDIFPTICDLTGSDIPTSVEGKSLFPALQDEQADIRETVYLSHAKEQRAIRTNDDWKLIQYMVEGQTHSQLFDLTNDPWEIQNLANRPEHQPKLQLLTQQLRQALEQYNDPFLTPSFQLRHTGFGQPVEVNLTQPIPGMELKYTTNGSPPAKESQVYQQPFLVSENTPVKMQLFDEETAVGPVVEIGVAVTKNIQEATLDPLPSSKYAGHGKYTLFDGQRGSTTFKDDQWLGYDGEDLEILIDLGTRRSVSTIGFGYLKQFGAWIFPPRKLEVWDDRDTQPFFTEVFPENFNDKNAAVMTFKKKITPRQMRYLKMKITGQGKCPDWHPGAGSKAWLFVDEVLVE